jgi:snapalysin
MSGAFIVLTATRRAGVVAAALTLSLLGAQPAVGAQPAADATPAPAPQATTVYYDASGAQEFQQAVDAAARIWNDNVGNVQLEPGNQPGFTVVADDGWPRTQTTALGKGTIWMGREAVNDGYDVTRIAAHEIGHILGLPDNRTGLCSDLMSGHSAPTACTNAVPSPAEQAQVEQNFAGATQAAHAASFTECFAARHRTC